MMLSKQCPDGQPRRRRGSTKELQVNDMTLKTFERQADRFAPVLMLFLGFVASVATVGVGF